MERQDDGETNGVEAVINLEVTNTFGLWMLAKQFSHRYSSQQCNQRGNKEQKKGSHMGKAVLGKNQGSQKTKIIDKAFCVMFK